MTARAVAELKFTISDFDVVTPGEVVICAVTGEEILLSELRYWSADLQEAYIDAVAATKRVEEVRNAE